MEITSSLPTKLKIPAHTYSRLKNFEICPRRYYECDVLKRWPEPRSEQLQWGDAVHKAIAMALTTGAPLPLHMRGYQPWLDKVNRTAGTLLVEDQAKLAITRDMEPCGWMSQAAWLRCIADVVKIDESHPGTALAVDWKTGKSANQDAVQLVVIALMLLIHFPKLLRVRADFIFLQDDAQTSVVVDRDEARDQWLELLPRLDVLERAAETETFPAIANKFCRSWCPVKDCLHWGK